MYSIRETLRHSLRTPTGPGTLKLRNTDLHYLHARCLCNFACL